MTLEPEYAEKLAILAEQVHIREGTLARSLLSQAIDAADIDARSIVEIRDEIPGAFERVELSIEEIRAGKGIPLDELEGLGTTSKATLPPPAATASR